MTGTCHGGDRLCLRQGANTDDRDVTSMERTRGSLELMHSRPIEEVPHMPVVEGGRAWGERTRGPQSEAKPQSKEPIWVPHRSYAKLGADGTE